MYGDDDDEASLVTNDDATMPSNTTVRQHIFVRIDDWRRHWICSHGEKNAALGGCRRNEEMKQQFGTGLRVVIYIYIHICMHNAYRREQQSSCVPFAGEV